MLHFQCTQAMLWAIGVGAKRWTGPVGKASLGRTCDSNLKKVRFSTSALFSLSVGLEIIYPRHFLLLATIAHVLKSIAYAAYLSASASIHRSLALGNNLADISAKGQVVAVCCSSIFGCRYVATFLHDRGHEVYPEVRAAYVNTMSKVLSAHFRSYIQALEKLQLDIVTRSDLLGVEDAGTRSTGLFSRPREPLKNRGAVFALGDRASVLKLVLVLWPRLKLVFDMHLSSLRTANPRALWEDDVRPHYVALC